MRGTSITAAAAVWLAFTRPELARAEPSRWPGSGPSARLGTAVGFAQLGAETVTTLGGEVGLGYRIGRLTLEAQYDRLQLLEYVEEQGGNAYRGELHRYGVGARVFFLDLALRGARDPDWVWRFHAEVGLGRQIGRWSSGDAFARNDLATGAGWLLEHRLGHGDQPFRSVGWHFGWQLATAEVDRVELATERTSCKTCGPPMPGSDLDASLTVSCALLAAW